MSEEVISRKLIQLLRDNEVPLVGCIHSLFLVLGASIEGLTNTDKSLEDARRIIDAFKSNTLNVLSEKGWE